MEPLMSNAELLQQAPPNNIKMFRAMVTIGSLCALLIVMAFETTLPIIKKNKTEALEKAVFKVLPGAKQRVTFKKTDNGFEPMTGEVTNEQVVYAGFNDQNKLIGLAIEASGQGFQDVLNILYGYSIEKQAVVGFYVLESRETPGLGDKIEKDENFLKNFEALDVSLDESLQMIKNAVIPVKNGTKENPWQVDCITGATISSKAIGNIISASSQYWCPIIYANKESFKKE
jgi:electron transport complex protein RnfG